MILFLFHASMSVTVKYSSSWTLVFNYPVFNALIKFSIVKRVWYSPSQSEAILIKERWLIGADFTTTRSNTHTLFMFTVPNSSNNAIFQYKISISANIIRATIFQIYESTTINTFSTCSSCSRCGCC